MTSTSLIASPDGEYYSIDGRHVCTVPIDATDSGYPLYWRDGYIGTYSTRQHALRIATLLFEREEEESN